MPIRQRPHHTVRYTTGGGTPPAGGGGGDPTPDPPGTISRLTSSDVTFLGSFYIGRNTTSTPSPPSGHPNSGPRSGYGGLDLLAYNPAGNGGAGSLYTAGHETVGTRLNVVTPSTGGHLVAEVSIPTLKDMTAAPAITDLNKSGFLDGWYDALGFDAGATPGCYWDFSFHGLTGGNRLEMNGGCVYDGKLYLGIRHSYNNSSPSLQYYPFLRKGLNLSTPDAEGVWRLGPDPTPNALPWSLIGASRGPKKIPAGLQSLFGGHVFSTSDFQTQGQAQTNHGFGCIVWTPPGSFTPAQDRSPALGFIHPDAQALMWWPDSERGDTTKAYWIENDAISVDGSTFWKTRNPSATWSRNDRGSGTLGTNRVESVPQSNHPFRGTAERYREGIFVQTPTGKSAFIGLFSACSSYGNYYGAINRYPDGAGSYTTAVTKSSTGNGYRPTPSWPMLAFHDVEELGQVYSGTRERWEVKGYESMDLSPYIYDQDGWARETQVGAMDYDEDNARLFVSYNRLLTGPEGSEPLPFIAVFQLS